MAGDPAKTGEEVTGSESAVSEQNQRKSFVIPAQTDIPGRFLEPINESCLIRTAPQWEHPGNQIIMLRPPHSRYQRIYTYHFNRRLMPRFDDDPDFIGLWQENDSAIYFFHHSREREMAALAERTGATLFYQADLDYREWESGQEISPFTVGPLRIAPIWEPGGGDIVIDPGVVFGTGFHPTTRLCLEGLTEVLAERPAPRLVDLGTGSGLLAIAGSKLGVKSVFACDFNPLACQTAKANSLRNQTAIDVAAVDLFASFPKGEGGILVANLHLELLLHLCTLPEFWRHDFLILAGFRSPQEEKLLSALPLGLVKFRWRKERESWCCWLLEGTRKGKSQPIG